MNDFDDLLKQIPGLNEFIADETAVADSGEPMTMADLEFLPDLTTLDKDGLEALHRRLEGLYSRLEDGEPGPGEAHDAWEDSLDTVSDFLDGILDRLDALDEMEASGERQ